MSLDNASILVICEQAQIGSGLVELIAAADGDVIYAATACEALQRLAQFRFAGAVLATCSRAAEVADALRVKEIAFCVFGMDFARSVPIFGRLIASEMEELVPILTRVIKR